MKLSYPSLASAALVAFGTSTAAEAAPPTKFRVDHTARCKYLHTKCKGGETTLSAIFTDQRGETIYGLAQFKEEDDYVTFDKRAKLGGIGYIHGVSQWDAQGGGLKIFAQRKMKVTENAVVALGAYAGKLKGDIDWRSRIDVRTDPFTIKLYGRTYAVKGYDRNLWRYHKRAEGDAFYGGITLDSGYVYKTTSKMMLIAGQTATAGLDLVEAGVNAGLIVSTHSAHGTRTPTGAICDGHLALPRHGTNFMINGCVSQRYHDALYKAKERKAARLADRINSGLANLAEIVRYEGYVPAYDAKRVLEEFGVTPYDLRAHIQLSVGHESGLSAGVSLPVGKDRQRWDPYIYGTFVYSY